MPSIKKGRMKDTAANQNISEGPEDNTKNPLPNNSSTLTIQREESTFHLTEPAEGVAFEYCVLALSPKSAQGKYQKGVSSSARFPAVVKKSAAVEIF
jgi:hypothetical protein